MRITSLRIRNFKSIRNMYIENIDNALILVGQNNTGKTAVLDAVRAVRNISNSWLACWVSFFNSSSTAASMSMTSAAKKPSGYSSPATMLLFFPNSTSNRSKKRLLS